MRFRLDSWQSDYAFPYELAEPPEAEISVDVDVTVEAPAHEWAAITPHHTVPVFPTVRFIDGVQASDAIIWIHEPGRDQPHPGLVASWGAGVIACTPTGAEMERIVIERGVFSDARTLGPIIAGNLTWRPRTPEATGDAHRPGEGAIAPGGTVDPAALRERLGSARRRLEDVVGRISQTVGTETLVVHDGLLHAGAMPLNAIGLAKRAHRIYLPESLQRLQRTLRRGERTPLFSVDPTRRKLSFYLALSDPLPPAVAEPGSCVARIEFAVSTQTTPGQASAFADRVARTLPPFASEPHVDPRAPQNLMPIRSLEAELRRLLGRPSIIRGLLATEAAVSQPA